MDIYFNENDNQPFIAKIQHYLSSHKITYGAIFAPNTEPRTMFINWVTRFKKIATGNTQQFTIDQNISELDCYEIYDGMSNTAILQQMSLRKMAIKYGLEVTQFQYDGCHKVKRLVRPSPAHAIMTLLVKLTAIESDSFEQWAVNHQYAISDNTALPTYQNHTAAGIKFQSLFNPSEIDELRAILHNY